MLEKVKLIGAEPWDAAPAATRSAAFPAGWAEWNDKFRDTVRDFCGGEASPSALAPRLCASPDVFQHRGRQPGRASIRHCARRLHAQRPGELQREAQRGDGEENRDGHSHNRSGTTARKARPDDEAILGLRKRQMKNISPRCCSAGHADAARRDEFAAARGQQHAYCQDNELSGSIGSTTSAKQRLIRSCSASPGCATAFRSCARSASSPGSTRGARRSRRDLESAPRARK